MGMSDERAESRSRAASAMVGKPADSTSLEQTPRAEAARDTVRASFFIRSFFELVAVADWAFLSTPDDGSYFEKDLLSAGGTTSEFKATVEERLAGLCDRVDFARDRPLIALGMRNNLVNPRAMVCVGDSALAVVGETPERSRRPYYGIAFRRGRFTMELWPPEDGKKVDFFCAGVPVLWDDMTPDELFGAILTEASDHSHVYELPRGKHPEATDATRELWKRLHEVFLDNLHAERAVAEVRMREALERSGPLPPRERSYLNSVVGVDAVGNLVNIVGNGQLEDLGRAAAARGCRRAVCVENSGSVSPTFFPEGSCGPGIPLLRAPNFRPKGRVYLFVCLSSPLFGTLPSTD